MMPNKDTADIPLEFNKTQQEPDNIFPQKLLDSEYKPSPALHEYAMEANRRINDFFQYLVTGNTADRSKSYIGHWILENTNGEKKEAENRQRGMNGVPDMPAIFYRRKINYSIAVPVPIHIFIFPKAATYI